MAPLDFDLPFFLKETQLQHGLRGEDYDRYHSYLSNRVATLRKQVHLSNDKKRFLHKEITANNATDVRHLILIVFYAERCWAAAEMMQARRQLLKDETRPGEKTVPGGYPPPGQYRKRLNKAVHWTQKLVEVANAVASERLQLQSKAYHAEVQGRCFAAHDEMSKAKAAFLDARNTYFALLKRCEADDSAGILRQKLTELDDRVLYCMQRLKEDVLSYAPEKEDGAAGESKLGSTVLVWNDQPLNVYSMKVKDSLREARAVPVEEMEAKVLETYAGTPVPVGQLNKVLDAMDRRIGYYNDALAHARQDLRAADAGAHHKRELQLIVHYFLFHVAEETLKRKLFMADIYARRFRATERALQLDGRARKAELTPAQYASSQEVARVYETGLDTVEEMELLPGVSGRKDTEAYLAVCKAGRVLFTGEGWRVLGQAQRAEACYNTAVELVRDALEFPRAKQLHEEAQRCGLQVCCLNQLASSTEPGETLEKLCDALACSEELPVVGVAKNIVVFPPAHQIAPAKPAFVDIASTYIDFDREETAATTHTHVAAAAQSQQSQQSQQSSGGKSEKKWGFKWGWGSK
eukprot:gene7306-5148_t